MRCWSIGLPQRHDIAAELELSGENARVKDRGKGLAQLDTSREKLEIRAAGDAIAIADERAVLPTLVLPNLGDGVG
jgi:hypothetical protein